MASGEHRCQGSKQFAGATPRAGANKMAEPVPEQTAKSHAVHEADEET